MLMKVDVLFDVTISASGGGGDLTCAYPLATLSRDGSVVCVYRRGKEKHSYDGVLVSQRSTDGGRSWSPAARIFDGRHLQPPQTAGSGGICTCGDGSLFTVHEATEVTRPDVYIFSEEGSTQRSVLITARSTDNGVSWHPHRCIEAEVLGKNPLGPTSSPVPLPDGRLFISGERHHPGGQLGICATFSCDHGETLETVRDSVVDPTAKLNFCDARFALLDDGELLGLFWTFRAGDEETVQVHRSVSNDDGHTWSIPRPVGFLGQITAPLAAGGDTLLAASNYRWPPDGVRLWVSRDRGLTWPEQASVQMWDSGQKKIVARPTALADRNHNDGVWDALPGFTFGTPDLTALSDGTVLLTYYAEVNGMTHVRACGFHFNVD